MAPMKAVLMIYEMALGCFRSLVNKFLRAVYFVQWRDFVSLLSVFFSLVGCIAFWSHHESYGRQGADGFFELVLCVQVFTGAFLVCLIHLALVRCLTVPCVALLVKSALVMMCIFHIGSVLFGAPVFRYWDRTLALSLLLTSLILPSMTNNIRLNINEEILNYLRLESMNTVPLFVVVAAWSGAVVIPLDWDRSWQLWPEPCCFAALVGCLAGNLTQLATKLPKSERLSI